MSLVAYNSDSDDEAEESKLFTSSDYGDNTVVAQGSPQITELIKHSSPLPTDFFSLNSSDEEDDDLANVEMQSSNRSSSNTVPATPIKDFWTDEPSEDWQHPESIWPATVKKDDSISNNAVAIRTKPGKRELKRFNETAIDDVNFYSKRMRQNLIGQQASSVAAVDESSNKSAPVYFVHHKVAPLVNQPAASCRVPRTAGVTMNNAHSAAVNRIVWCRGQYSHLLASASMDRCVKVWNVFSKQQFLSRTFSQHEKAVRDVCWSSDGRLLLTGSFDKTSRIFDVDAGVEKQRLDHPNFVTCARYHPSNSHLVVTGSINSLYCWDVRDNKRPVRQFRHKDSFGQVNDLIFARHGVEFFTSADLATRDSADRNIMAWDFATGAVLSNQIYHERFTCPRLRLSPDGSTLLAQSQGNYIAAFSTIRPYKMDKCRRYESHKVDGYPVGFDVSVDGTLVVSGSADSRLTVYDARLARPIRQLHFDGNVICTDVAWHPLLGSTVAAATWGGAIVVWQ